MVNAAVADIADAAQTVRLDDCRRKSRGRAEIFIGKCVAKAAVQPSQETPFRIALAHEGVQPKPAGKMRGGTAGYTVGHCQPNGIVRLGHTGFVQPDLTHRRAVKQGILIACFAGTDHLKIGKLKHGNPDNPILI